MTRPAAHVTGQLTGSADGEPCTVDADGDASTLHCHKLPARRAPRPALTTAHAAANHAGIRIFISTRRLRVPIAGAHRGPFALIAALLRTLASA